MCVLKCQHVCSWELALWVLVKSPGLVIEASVSSQRVAGTLGPPHEGRVALSSQQNEEPGAEERRCSVPGAGHSSHSCGTARGSSRAVPIPTVHSALPPGVQHWCLPQNRRAALPVLSWWGQGCQSLLLLAAGEAKLPVKPMLSAVA